jgi:hypothetical protein
MWEKGQGVRRKKQRLEQGQGVQGARTRRFLLCSNSSTMNTCTRRTPLAAAIARTKPRLSSTCLCPLRVCVSVSVSVSVSLCLSFCPLTSPPLLCRAVNDKQIDELTAMLSGVSGGSPSPYPATFQQHQQQQQQQPANFHQQQQQQQEQYQQSQQYQQQQQQQQYQLQQQQQASLMQILQQHQAYMQTNFPSVPSQPMTSVPMPSMTIPMPMTTTAQTPMSMSTSNAYAPSLLPIPGIGVSPHNSFSLGGGYNTNTYGYNTHNTNNTNNNHNTHNTSTGGYNTTAPMPISALLHQLNPHPLYYYIN